ncbi:MAG: HAD-IIIC family phosphatase [Clostridiales bacterium]|nr:HAD-IIIC family phosphatase [Clostridiales bacterium]
MNREEILELLAEAMERDAAELAALPEDQPLGEWGLESIRFIRFVLAVEEKYQVEISDSDLLDVRFATLADLYAIFSKYLDPGAAPKKVLVCDCDNVLWHGVAGEEELWTNSAVRLFQNALIRLKDRGAILCLCSRNDPANIREAFEQLSMPLREEHVAGWQIGWNSKADSLKKLAEELNLPLDSFVFVDDSAYEIGLVRGLLPEVVAVQVDYADLSFIDRIEGYFWHSYPETDVDRTRLYKEQKEREKAKPLFDSAEEYNASLDTVLTCAAARPEETARLTELSQRTNQFNLSGRKYTSEEIDSRLSDSDYLVLSLQAADRYGDMGIVGAAVVCLEDADAVIESFFLSCRVFGRGFETALLKEIQARCADRTLYGRFVSTTKNGRYRGFYPENGVTLCE